MKNQQISISIMIVAIVLLFSGCGIFSLHPLYHKDDLILKNEMIGTWQNEKDKEMFLMIDTIGNMQYEFHMIDDVDTVAFVMGLLKLNNQYFIDLFPSDDCSGITGDKCESWEMMVRNYIPIHTFMKIDYLDDGIYLSEFDNERLIELFDQKRIRLAHEMAGEDDDYVVITASTDDLQKFITRYANDKDAFSETENYRRL